MAMRLRRGMSPPCTIVARAMGMRVFAPQEATGCCWVDSAIDWCEPHELSGRSQRSASAGLQIYHRHNGWCPGDAGRHARAQCLQEQQHHAEHEWGEPDGRL